MLQQTPDRLPHFVRIGRYGGRLMTITELRQRDELARMMRMLPKVGHFVQIHGVTSYLRNRMRIEFGTGGDDARSIPAELLEAATVLLIELTSKARAHTDNSYQGLKTFARDVVGAGHRFPNYRAYS